jgi:outer membrane autotransporter protein
LSAQAGLTINTGAALTTVMSSSIEQGALTVNGTLRARGIGVFGGTLSGTGLLQAAGGVGVSGAAQTAGTTAITGGTVAPGGAGAVGTLTFEGNVSFAGGTLALDIASLTSFDRLVVNNLAGATGTNGTFVSPTGGTLPSISVNFLGGYVPLWNQTFDVITAAGGVTGSFALASNLTGVLGASYAATGNIGRLTITARPFAATYNFTSDEQRSVARALDTIRFGGQAGPLAALFAQVDPLSELAARAAFQQLAGLMPLQLARGGYADTTVAMGQIADRVDVLRRGGGAGVTVSGLEGLVQTADADPFVSMKIMAGLGASTEAAAGGSSFSLRPGWGAFIQGGGTVQGEGAITTFAGTADLNSYGATAGLDYSSATGWYVGAAISYVSGSQSAVNGQIMDSNSSSLQATVYGGWTNGTYFMNGWLSAGRRAYDTTRFVTLLGGTQTLVGDTRGSTGAFGVRLGADFAATETLTVTPFIGFDWRRSEADAFVETGGSAALAYGDEAVEWKEARIGVKAEGSFAAGSGTFRPSLTAAYVHNLDDKALVATSAFAAVPGIGVTATSLPEDGGYLEYKAGFDYVISENMDVGLAYEGTLGKDTVRIGIVQANLSVRW